jgi:hypothetical protein
MTTTSSCALLVVGPTPADGCDPLGGDSSAALGLVSLVEAEVPAGPALVLVHDDRPTAADPTATGRSREVAVARAALGREEVVLRAVLGPVSRFLLLRRALLACDAPVGIIAAGVDVLLHQLRTVALLGSVSRLESPAPALRQHARGLLPGGCFLVDDRGVQAIKHRLPRGGRGEDAELAVSAVRGPGDWPERLWSTLGPPSPQPEPWAGAGRSCWGTNRWAEITVAARPVTALAADLEARPTRTCGWCGRLGLDSHPCPFCGSAPSRRPSTAAASTTRPSEEHA